MNRVVASLLACSISSIITYPLDTMFISKQFNSVPQKYYSGFKLELFNTCATTGIFFQVYETCLANNLNPGISSTASTLASTIVNTPLNILKRNSQKKYNNLITQNTNFLKKYNAMYITTIFKKVPENFIKYCIYENILKNIWNKFDPGICGAISALFAAMISNVIMFPIETANARISCGLNTGVLDSFSKKNVKYMYTGFRIYLLYSIISNVVGHYVLEKMSPRIV